ncbi:MAG TPA: winged helix-turn-helix domain-containing protein, partial [Candidatus Omnitrophota bacterium]|nr:winged helix-turn-helix domain-containing protein [Candidatus Omnitrophota bacterium]
MKEKIIETAGKTWRTLGEKGELNITQLPKVLKEDEAVVYQALGWLAREEKINYTVKNKQTTVSLVEAEARAFKNTLKPSQSRTSSITSLAGSNGGTTS